ncbi:melanocyte-stimulating hormone receptor [Nematostella vectensis]|uniref:melanocyte-stimulating hormone receptor n=1 Tax=Nematostella vectensis TaxID=45351 RepID=UPI0020778094|nr:melanocyte-stimulating hormone receptor [Nematostella vectensis]
MDFQHEFGLPGNATTAVPSSTPPQALNDLWGQLELITFGSGIFVSIISLVTLLGNGLLILAIWRDPFRTFRIPSTVFILGLCVADFLTGLIVGPIYAFVKFASYLRLPIKGTTLYGSLYQGCLLVSYVTMNASYGVLLLLTWSQYIAVKMPHKHRSLVSTKRAVTGVICAWFYALLFALLPVMGVPNHVVSKMDLWVNTTGCLVMLLVAYICLYTAFHRHATKVYSEQSTSEHHPRASRRRRRRSERQLTVVTLALVVFIVLFTLPSTVTHYIDAYWTPSTAEEKIRYSMALQLSGNVLLLKFALDPFIYCWRLSSYRRALKSVLTCRRQVTAVECSTEAVSGAQTLRTIHGPPEPRGTCSYSICTENTIRVSKVEVSKHVKVILSVNERVLKGNEATPSVNEEVAMDRKVMESVIEEVPKEREEILSAGKEFQKEKEVVPIVTEDLPCGTEILMRVP